jgi:hypothetical protein
MIRLKGRNVTVMDDRAEIMSVQNAYAVALDTRDFGQLRQVFVPDCEVSFGPGRTWHSLDSFIAWAEEFHTPIGATAHHIATHSAEVHDGRADASCYLHAVLVGFGELAVSHVFGRYTDEFVHTDEGWRIARRRSEVLWRQETPA